MKERRKEIVDISETQSIGKRSAVKSESQTDQLNGSGTEKKLAKSLIREENLKPRTEKVHQQAQDELECAEEVDTSNKDFIETNQLEASQKEPKEIELSEFKVKLYLGVREFIHTLSSLQLSLDDSKRIYSDTSSN